MAARPALPVTCRRLSLAPMGANRRAQDLPSSRRQSALAAQRDGVYAELFRNVLAAPPVRHQSPINKALIKHASANPIKIMIVRTTGKCLSAASTTAPAAPIALSISLNGPFDMLVSWRARFVAPVAVASTPVSPARLIVTPGGQNTNQIYIPTSICLSRVTC